MAVARYRKGFRLEHQAKKLLESQGYFVVRSAGSHSPCDLVALKQGEILLIQVKASSMPPPAERKALVAVARQAGGKPIAMYKQKRTWIIKEVTDDKEAQTD